MFRNMNIRRLQQSEILDVFRLLSSNAWAHRLSDVDQFAQLIEAIPDCKRRLD
jgi:hypothetical protein